MSTLTTSQFGLRSHLITDVLKEATPLIERIEDADTSIIATIDHAHMSATVMALMEVAGALHEIRDMLAKTVRQP